MRSMFTLRRATDRDRPVVQALRHAATGEFAVGAKSRRNGAVWRTPAQDLDDLISAAQYFVAELDGQIVAGAGWEPHTRIPGTAVVRSVFSDRGQSALAAEMVQAAEDSAVSAGYDLILIPALENAARFYRALGYMSADPDEMILEAGQRVGYRRMWKHAT